MGVQELLVIVQGDAANVMALNEFNMVLLTGYLMIAYFTGANLTLFQVSFVNCVFILSRVATFVSIQGVLNRAQYFLMDLAEADPGIPVGSMVTGGYGGTVQAAIFVLITVGALIFMWQVRHPKTE